MNKKGAIFTIISVMLVAGLIFFYVNSNQYSFKERNEVIKVRINTMNSFIQDIEHDVERGLFISSMRTLIGTSEFIAENGSFIENFDSVFNEIMFNGTVNNRTINITKDANFGTWILKIEDVGQKLDIDVEFEDLKVRAHQEEPWAVIVTVSGVLNLTDRKEIATWKRPLNISTVLDITDFEDPLYTVVSSGRFTNTIVKSNITDFVQGSNASNLVLHANSSWYRESSSAPNFLMRYQGNFSPSPQGIESIVNMPNLQSSAPELYDASKSSVDYVYFGNISVADCRVNETKNVISWFRLDNTSLVSYEANCES